MRPSFKTFREASMNKGVTASGGQGTLDELKMSAVNFRSVHATTTVAKFCEVEPQIFEWKANPKTNSR